jgi:putative Holliday junction resolvase
MKLIAVDYGEARVGIAISDGKLAEPLTVIEEKRNRQLVEKIRKIVEREGVEKIIVGVSEGEMGKKQKSFGHQLSESLKLAVDFEDETLTTEDAKRLAIEADIKRSKRKSFEDAYAATLILQKWLDSRI